MVNVVRAPLFPEGLPLSLVPYVAEESRVPIAGVLHLLWRPVARGVLQCQWLSPCPVGCFACVLRLVGSL